MKQSNMYIKNYSGKKVAVKLEVLQYAENWQIAIFLYDSKWEYYSDLSVFIDPFKYLNFMAVDTNNLPNAEEFIQEYKLWQLVGYTHSWFCSYPIYEMDLEELSKWDKEWVEKLVNSESSDEDKFSIRKKLS